MSYAADGCTVVGKLASSEGRIEVQRHNDTSWKMGKLNESLCQGDTIRSGERSRATVALINHSVLRIDQNTALQLTNLVKEEGERSFIDLVKGAFQSFSRKPRRMTVNTPYLNGSIEGTEFVFRVEDGETRLAVFEGTVVASNDQGKLAVTPGMAVSGAPGKAPTPYSVVRPRDAAQWSLYYPPIMVAQGSSEALHQAAQALAVGRVEEARAGIDQALAKDAKSGSALALRAVINVVQNNKAEALADAQKAVAASPGDTATWIALSYAQQANYQITEARDSLLKATQAQPKDALAWARLAELHLMLGERQQSAEAANTSANLAPDLSRTQLATGYAALAEFRITDAHAAFEKAIALDSADPLPHLGLGLAKINAGALEEGRRELEVAVALDSNSALLRSYLGKAYFEETRSPLDAEQLEIAKQLDPLDPTAFLYDGIRKQTENRPVEALADLEKSAELNDNRAVYRGGLLLDKDRAARGISNARAYSDLGFDKLGTNEAARSLALDPANASAHRFLADTYRDTSGQEISRVSELLQAQLLQDINIAPLQPSAGETNINLSTLGGPASAGFNEFTPLFQRNMAQANVSAMVGSNDTHAGELAASAILGPISLGAGAYTYRSDGYRPNNDLSHDVYNLFAQAALAPELNLQAEFRSRHTHSGDILAQFDPDYFLRDYRRSFDEESIRVGARYSPTARSTFLLSAITSDRTENSSTLDKETYAFADIWYDFKSSTHAEANQVEGQYIFQEQNYNLIGGVSSARVKLDINILETFIDSAAVPPTPFFDFSTDISAPIQDTRGYLYGNIRTGNVATWTLGLSYSDYQQDAYKLHVERVSPKLGLQWDVTNALRLRAAGFQTVKPALATNRTLEPTQIAGFNQFFDDANATKSTGYGVGLDWRISQNVATGLEVTGRKFKEGVWDGTDTIFENRKEQKHRIYGYWAPSAHLALRAEALYDKYESDEAALDINRPRLLKTVSVPLQIRYFHPQGFFAGAGATFVDQEVRRASCTLGCGTESFVTTDVIAGYRLPKRMGILSIGIYNLFDRQFKYQGNAYRSFQSEAQSTPYIPERTVMGRISLSF